MKTISSLENELFGLVFEGGGWRQVVVPVVGSRGGHGGPPRRSASYRSLPNHGSRGKKKKFADVPLRPLSLVVPASKQPSPMKTSTYTRFRRRRLWCRGVVVVLVVVLVVVVAGGAGGHGRRRCGGGGRRRHRCGWSLLSLLLLS